MKKSVYYCTVCNTPLLQEDCNRCGNRGKTLNGDLRPVFNEELRLMEKITKFRFGFDIEKAFLWANGRTYLINGQPFIRVTGGGINTPPKIKLLDEGYLGKEILSENEVVQRLKDSNEIGIAQMVGKAVQFVRETREKYSDRTIIVSFSGGKDSTVISDIVMKALGTTQIWHAFGDTTLEFPTTYEYIERYKSSNHIPFVPQVLVKSNADFYDLCEKLGVPSRIQRWCCSMFKTGTLGKAFNWIAKGKGRGTLTFDGIRSSESARREGYDPITEKNKIGSQVLASPIKEWWDLDVWTYILINSLSFNDAYRFGYTRVGCIPCPFNSPWSEMMTSFVFPEQAKKWHDILLDYALKIGRPDVKKYVVSGGWKTRAGGAGLNKRRVFIEKHVCERDEEFLTYEVSRDIGVGLLEYIKPLGDIKNVQDDGIIIKFNLFAHKTKKNIAYIECIRIRNQLRVKSFINYDKEYFINYFMKIIKFRLSLINKQDDIDKKKVVDPQQYFLTRLDKQIRKFQACHYSCSACKTICPFKAISGNVPLPDCLEEHLSENEQYTVNDKKCTRCMTCVEAFRNGCIASNSLHISKSRR